MFGPAVLLSVLFRSMLVVRQHAIDGRELPVSGVLVIADPVMLCGLGVVLCRLFMTMRSFIVVLVNV